MTAPAAHLRILTLCGSLRARSSNQVVLRVYARLLGPAASVVHYGGLAALPHFNPDLDGEPAAVPLAVADLRRQIAAADAIVISTPEYAHALPGSFKNALDWLVSDPAVAGKRVAILHIARGSTWALDSLCEVLRTLTAEIIDPACVSVPLGSNQVDEETVLAREDIRLPLQRSAEALLASMTTDSRLHRPATLNGRPADPVPSRPRSSK